MTKTKRKIIKIICFALLLVISGGLILSAFSVEAAAQTQTYSNVLDDLQKDSSFNVEDYPDVADDYSLDVIHVAEGENGEVFIYVYQPSNATKDLRASKINMALENPTKEDVEFSLYNLSWLNSNGVFDKYLVNDLTVSNEEYRYYSIATIYRPFDESIDDSALDDDDIVNFKGYGIGVSWCKYIYNDTYCSKSCYFKTAAVTIHSVGFVSFFEGFDFGCEYVDAHFVAFSIDNYDVKHIYNAKITYTISSYTAIGQTRDNLSYVSGGTPSTLEDTLTDGEVSTVDGFLWNDYSWNVISDTKTFIEDTENYTNQYISENDRLNLAKSQFVFRFLETECHEGTAMGTSALQVTGTRVEEVGLLQIKFLANNHKVYNLGVVSDLVSDDGAPDYVVSLFDNMRNSLEESWEKLIALLSLVLVGVFFVLVFCFGISASRIFNILFSIIAFPFKLLFGSKKKRHKKRE